jgi:hypothetical protein
MNTTNKLGPHAPETQRVLNAGLYDAGFTPAPISKTTIVLLSNLTNTLLAALDKLGAPQDVKDALTESGDCDHVLWWITEKAAPHHGSTSPALIAHEVGKASAVVDAYHAGRADAQMPT